MFQRTGLTQTNQILVMDPGCLQACAELFDAAKTPNALELLKAYARLNLANGLGGLLNQEFTDASNAFNLAYFGQDLSAPLEDTARRQLGTIQDYYETPEDSVRIDTAKAIGKFLIRSDESDSESQVTISLEDEDFAKKLEEVASDSAGKQMLEFAIAMYEKNNSD